MLFPNSRGIKAAAKWAGRTPTFLNASRLRARQVVLHNAQGRSVFARKRLCFLEPWHAPPLPPGYPPPELRLACLACGGDARGGPSLARGAGAGSAAPNAAA